MSRWLVLLLLLAGTSALGAGTTDATALAAADAAQRRGDQRTAYLSYLELAGEGNRYAQYRLARLYFEGSGVKQDPASGLRWLQASAAQHLGVACFDLGSLYEHGKQVEQDFTQAAFWYRIAARQGHVLAQIRLGRLHAEGRGVSHDEQVAVRWFDRAARAGHATAQLEMARMFMAGRGVGKDLGIAYAWAALSAAQHDQNSFDDASELIRALGPRLSTEQLNRARRFEVGLASRPPLDYQGVPRQSPLRAQPSAADTQSNQVLASEVRALLGQLGYSPGTSNSLLDQQTAAAITAFERAQGSTTTGRISPELRDRLRLEAISKPARSTAR